MAVAPRCLSDYSSQDGTVALCIVRYGIVRVVHLSLSLSARQTMLMGLSHRISHQSASHPSIIHQPSQAPQASRPRFFSPLVSARPLSSPRGKWSLFRTLPGSWEARIR